MLKNCKFSISGETYNKKANVITEKLQSAVLAAATIPKKGVLDLEYEKTMRSA